MAKNQSNQQGSSGRRMIGGIIALIVIICCAFVSGIGYIIYKKKVKSTQDVVSAKECVELLKVEYFIIVTTLLLKGGVSSFNFFTIETYSNQFCQKRNLKIINVYTIYIIIGFDLSILHARFSCYNAPCINTKIVTYISRLMMKNH